MPSAPFKLSPQPSVARPHPTYHYALSLKPLYRTGRVTSTEYEALIHEHRDGTFKDPAARLVWRTTGVLRRDVKRLADSALAALRFKANPSAFKISYLSDKRGQLPHPMLGRTQSPETKAKISAAIKAHHAAGTFAGKQRGRPTNAEAREAHAERAKVLGITVAQYLAGLRAVKAQRAAERNKATALLYPERTPQELKRLQRRNLTLLPPL